MKITLDQPIYAYELAELYEQPTCNRDKLFTSIATHSEECDTETLFFALDGERVCADRFIGELAARGVCCVGRVRAAGCYTVPSAKNALLSLASYYKKTRLRSLLHTVAITGSVGKTTTKDATAALLCAKYEVHKTKGNRNSEIGLPLSILDAPSNTRLLVLELGINHPDEMLPMALCADADIAVITGIGYSHIGNFTSREQIAREKAYVCARRDCTVLTDASEALLCDLANRIPVGSGGACRLYAEGGGCRYVSERVSLFLPFSLPERDIASALTYALAVGELVGLDEDELLQGAHRAIGNCGRRREFTACGIRIIDDSYNCSPESLALAIEILMRGKGRKFAVLSDILELGRENDRIHRAIGKMIADAAPDGIFYLGKMGVNVSEAAYEYGYEKNRFHLFACDEHRECAQAIRCELSKGDTLLLKGSHGGALWRIGEMLCENEINQRKGNEI